MYVNPCKNGFAKDLCTAVQMLIYATSSDFHILNWLSFWKEINKSVWGILKLVKLEKKESRRMSCYFKKQEGESKNEASEDVIDL